MYILAHTLLPITSAPISKGVLHIEKGIIKQIGSLELLRNIPASEIIDLSKQIITPGFVNTHAHLELTTLGSLSKKSGAFSDWIEQIIEKKSSLDEQQIIEGYKKGVALMMSSGVTTVLDNISFNMPWEIIPHFPLKIIPNAEVLGANIDVALDIYAHIKELREFFKTQHPDHTFFISAHSVHALHPKVLQTLLTEIKTPQFIHLAESEAEWDYFQTQSGGIAKLITKRGIEIPKIHQHSGLNVISKMGGELSNITIIHGNYLSPSDLEIVVKNKTSV
ncbi:MAG: amidohydrolase, partial [uncultured bacterium]